VLSGRPSAESKVFGAVGDWGHLSDRVKDHLELAGVTRPEIRQKNTGRLGFRFHDLRTTFVTMALACGKSEAWAMDRSGHTTSGQLHNYRALSTTLQSVGEATGFANMAATIPELAALEPKPAGLPIVARPTDAPRARGAIIRKHAQSRRTLRGLRGGNASQPESGASANSATFARCLKVGQGIVQAPQPAKLLR
jgi:hypothetical protein